MKEKRVPQGRLARRDSVCLLRAFLERSSVVVSV